MWELEKLSNPDKVRDMKMNENRKLDSYTVRDMPKFIRDVFSELRTFRARETEIQRHERSVKLHKKMQDETQKKF